MFALYHSIILVVLLLVLGNVTLNLFCFDRLRAVAPPESGPLVSVLVPARNEARNIEACLRSLLLQDYAHYELLVLDDHSEDSTAAIVEKLIAEVRNPRVTARLLRGQPLPEDWCGKNWACYQLADAANGEFLLFTDADTIHSPGTVSSAMDYACRNNASLVSAWPRLLTGTLGEKLIVPVIPLIGFGFCPLWLLRWIQQKGLRMNPKHARAISASNGQFMFFKREAYERIGGHAAVRAHLVEDVALGREVAARMGEGMRLFNCDGLHFSTVRMYRSLGETWEGFTKNIRAVFEEQRAAFWLFGLAQGMCLFAPCVFIFIAPAPVRKIVAAQVAVIYLIRLLLALRFRTSWIGALLHPIGMLLMMLIGLNSWRRSIGSGVVWKGRTYRPKI